jgi:uncharacterized protein (DUF1015 family)
MADIYPFRPWRYAAAAGPLEHLATQPYDTIPPALADQYRARSPYNLVRLILPGNDYAGAATRLATWIESGILRRDDTPALFVYEQSFCLPETGEPLVRRGFIGLGNAADYGSSVHRHERTLDAPKADRLELLRHTRTQFGSIFMMYPDPSGTVETLIDAILPEQPTERFTDDQQTLHTLWRVDNPEWIAAIQRAMADKPLIIVDGHHRYEAALRYRDEHPDCPAAGRIMMACVNLHSPGLRTLAAHRVVAGMEPFPMDALLQTSTPLGTAAALEAAWKATPPGRVRFGLALSDGLRLLEVDRPDGALNLTVLHDRILHRILGITPEAIARQRFVTYCRGIGPAIERVTGGQAQAAFLVEPLQVAEVARLAVSGATLPQKSTDFYPKLASGLTMYRFDE